MFTGIIEDIGKIKNCTSQDGNILFVIESTLTPELKVDESISHNGVCLTVTACTFNEYTVVAIKETLDKSNLDHLRVGDSVNLERAMKLDSRLDGHMVQGHVDTTLKCLAKENKNGSYEYWFELPSSHSTLVVSKGSICLNGVSLTIALLEENRFSVAIIPYTYAHTTFSSIQKGDLVNVEFDILGKYVQRMLKK